MSLAPRRILLSLCVLVAIGLPARAEHGVYDEARLFSHEKAIDAGEKIDELRHATHKDLLIETITSAKFLSELSPEERKEYHDTKNRSERAQFFEAQARIRASRWQVNGVYVLLCAGSNDDEEPRRGAAYYYDKIFKEPLRRDVVGHAVIVWPPAGAKDSNEKYFPPEAQKELDEKLAKVPARMNTADKSKDKKHDKTEDKVLEEIVADVSTVIKAKVGNVEAETFRWTHVLWAALGLCGVWLVLGLVRGRVAARQGASGPVTGANDPFASLYGTAGLLALFEAWRTPATPVEPAPPAPEVDPLSAEGSLHPDDQDAMAQPPGPLPEEQSEAAP